MNFNSQECAWADISVGIFGEAITTLRAIKYGKEVEKEAYYAAGSKPVGIGEGNEKFDGASLKVLKEGLRKMNNAARAAGFADITKVPCQAIIITINYKLGFGRPLQTDTLFGVSFTKFDKGMEQGAKFMEVELPFIFLDLEEGD
jgi:hypothetical protein